MLIIQDDEKNVENVVEANGGLTNNDTGMEQLDKKEKSKRNSLALKMPKLHRLSFMKKSQDSTEEVRVKTISN